MNQFRCRADGCRGFATEQDSKVVNNMDKAMKLALSAPISQEVCSMAF